MASTPGHHTHLVPTHVRTPETLLTLAGVSLSVRQFLLLLVGVALSYRVWLLLGIFAQFPTGQVLRWIVTVLPLCTALAFAFVSLASRSLDSWMIVMLRYGLRPHCFVWRSVRFFDPGFWGLTAQEDLYGTHTK